MAPQAKHRQSCPGAIISHPERLRLSTASRALGHLQLSLPSPLLASFVAGVAVASLPSATKNWQWKGKRRQHCLGWLSSCSSCVCFCVCKQGAGQKFWLACCTSCRRFRMRREVRVCPLDKGWHHNEGFAFCCLSLALSVACSRGCSPRWASRRRRVRMGSARPRGQKQQPLHHLLLQVSSLSRK